MYNSEGTFSSSSIYQLMSSGRAAGSVGKPFTTYVEEKDYEKKLGRPLTTEVKAKPLKWGNLCEYFGFQNMGLEYSIVSKDRLFHNSIENWSGTPDCLTTDKVIDIKSPWTLTSFCQMEKSFRKGVDAFKKLKPIYYWQLVSNAILSGKSKAEIVLYVPYKSELDEIKKFIGTPEFLELGLNEHDYNFVTYADDSELPYLIDGGHYNNVTSFEFEITNEEKALLIARVNLANIELEKLLKC